MEKSGIGVKIAEKRRTKGLTQEDLAEKSGVTTRTIQRIESGSVFPQMHTIKLLAEALNLDVNELKLSLIQPLETVVQPQSPSLNSSYLALMHILPLLGIVLPFSNILVPIIMWLFLKNDHEEYDFQGKSILNFQMTMTILAALGITLLVIYFPIGAVLLLFTSLFSIILAFSNMKKALNGKDIYYPFSIKFL